MLSIPPTTRVYAYVKPADMRKSFSGLVGIVEQELGQQVESGGLFLFFNRRHNYLVIVVVMIYPIHDACYSSL